MGLRWIIRVSVAVAMLAGGAVFALWEDPDSMLGTQTRPEVMDDHDRARGMLRAEQYDEGIELLRSVLEREPRRAIAWELLGLMHERRAAPGDEDEAREARRRAIALYERAMRRDAWRISEHDQWYRLGWLHRRTGDEARAAQSFERARDAHLALATRARGELSADFLYNMACLAALTGRREEALDAWERAAAVGFLRFDRATRDPDLATIRDDPRFDAALEAARQRLENARARQREERQRLEAQQVVDDGAL